MTRSRTTLWSWTSALVVLACAPACGDDGSAGETSSESSTTGSGTTSGGTTSGGTTTAVADDTSTTSSDSDGGTTTSGSESSGGSDSSSDGTTTGTAPFDVPFSVLDPYGIPLTVRVAPGWVAITSAAQWDMLTGQPVPAGVSFPEQWLLFGSRGPQPFPGHALEASALTWDAGMVLVEGLAVGPDPDCETFQFTWPADTLLAIDALEVEIDGFDDQTIPMGSSCAMGASEAMRCDLDTPCATGLLCAGLIRTTVLSNSPWGLCGSTSYGGVFPGGGLPIPANGSIAEASMMVNGLTSVDTDVVIWVEVDHPAPEELVIELRNPDTNQVPVAMLQTSPLHPGGVGIVPNGFSGDESVNGTWTLVIHDDVVNGNNGNVVSWELEIMSRFD